MKKITLLLAALAITVSTNAQQVLSQSDSQIPDNGGVACATTGGGTSDNFLYRVYTPSNFDLEGTISITGAQFVPSYGNTSGDAEGGLMTVTAYASSGDDFPTGELVALASVEILVDEDTPAELTDFMFDVPVNVDASAEIILAADIPASPSIEDGGYYDLRIGVNAGGQTGESYLSSVGCGLTDLGVTFADINFPDNHLILNLIVDEALGLGDNSIAGVSIFPNPATNVINVDVPSNVELKSAILFDILGKNTGTNLVNGSINIADLAAGVYILNVETTNGSLTQKVVKK